MSDENLVTYNANGDAVSFSGPDAVELYRVAVLASTMGLYKSGMTFRGLTGRQILDQATAVTKKSYKRGEYDKAKADLSVWIAEMKAALPEEVRGAE